MCPTIKTVCVTVYTFGNFALWMPRYSVRWSALCTWAFKHFFYQFGQKCPHILSDCLYFLSRLDILSSCVHCCSASYLDCLSLSRKFAVKLFTLFHKLSRHFVLPCRLPLWKSRPLSGYPNCLSRSLNSLLCLVYILVPVETFGEIWMRRSTHKCRHSQSHARIVDNEARHSKHSRFLWLGTDLLTGLRELQDKTNVRFTLSFSSCLVLSRRECKPGIRFRRDAEWSLISRI